jgi:hypothetical protein
MGELKIGQEYPSANEGKYTSEILNKLRESVEKDYAGSKMLRRFHAKSLGLVEAEFTVEGGLPGNLQVGLFAAPKTYKAWVRFSNASTKVGSDAVKGARGMAIKVLGTGSSQLMQDAMGQTQDFLLITNNILFPGTVKDYLVSLKGLFGNKIFLVPLFLNPFNWPGIIAMAKSMVAVPNILEKTFFSATPFLFGEGKAIKWQARPLKKAVSAMPANPGPNFITAQLADDLKKGSFSFEICIQHQENPHSEPIENAAVAWKTPVTKVATITILQQEFDTEERRQMAESMAFSPWHCLPAHRPLGGLNRVRKIVYDELSRLRNKS